MGTNYSRKIGIFTDQSSLSRCHSEKDCNIAIPLSKGSIGSISPHCINLVALGPETSEFTLLTIAPFAAIRQKLAYHAKYLRISWTYLDPLYRFGRHRGLLIQMIIQIFVWRSPKGRCYDNQLNLGDVR